MGQGASNFDPPKAGTWRKGRRRRPRFRFGELLIIVGVCLQEDIPEQRPIRLNPRLEAESATWFV